MRWERIVNIFEKQESTSDSEKQKPIAKKAKCTIDWTSNTISVTTFRTRVQTLALHRDLNSATIQSAERDKSNLREKLRSGSTLTLETEDGEKLDLTLDYEDDRGFFYITPQSDFYR